MAVKKSADKQQKITLTKSLIGRKDDQIATAISLGLRKIGDITLQPVSDVTSGKINKIIHLIKVEESSKEV